MDTALSIPPGFRKTNWTDVLTNTYVYVRGMTDGKPSAYGPHRVVDSEHFLLENVGQKINFAAPDATLLYKAGPVVVMSFNEGVFTGFYSDVSLDVIAISQSLKDGLPPQARPCRPLALELLQRAHQKTIDRLAPAWAKEKTKWDITEAALKVEPEPEPEPESKFWFTLDNKLAVMQLVNDLLTEGCEFTVDKADSQNWMITIDQATVHKLKFAGAEAMRDVKVFTVTK